jgi:hypothetical protein
MYNEVSIKGNTKIVHCEIICKSSRKNGICIENNTGYILFSGRYILNENSGY